MTEWQTVTVMIALVGFVAAIVGPIVKLNTNITRLNVTMQSLSERLSRQEEENHESHKRIWEKNDEQDDALHEHDKILTAHEGRISRLENK